jgi:glycosyltransferase involved in cell wall biosynthesis
MRPYKSNKYAFFCRIDDWSSRENAVDRLMIDPGLKSSYQLKFMSPERSPSRGDISIAVLVPCYNEELTVSGVIREFREELPAAEIYVFDNNSTDKTIERAREAGAIVCNEKRQGKGYVVRSMFREIEADIYVLVDGDGTYPAHRVHDLIAPIVNSGADMTVGSRLRSESQSDFKKVNRFGNRVFRKVLNVIFKSELTDILSGYRAFTRKFVKETPVFASGFEIEAELTIKALERGSQIVEVPTDLRSRPLGSHSKIRVSHDGLVILSTIVALFRDYKPLTFFGVIGLLLITAGFVPGRACRVRISHYRLSPSHTIRYSRSRFGPLWNAIDYHGLNFAHDGAPLSRTGASTPVAFCEDDIGCAVNGKIVSPRGLM